MATKKKSQWPKVEKGSHLTVTTYEDGKTELAWDDEQLLADVRAALDSLGKPEVTVKKKKAKSIPEEVVHTYDDERLVSNLDKKQRTTSRAKITAKKKTNV